jgi:hypothetical protein
MAELKFGTVLRPSSKALDLDYGQPRMLYIKPRPDKGSVVTDWRGFTGMVLVLSDVKWFAETYEVGYVYNGQLDFWEIDEEWGNAAS